ncbi:MAG: Rne/Rng family ribonuclease, partial [Terriglobales bacterium]
MNKELYVSSTPHETRLALAEDGEIAEVYYEREQEYSLAGAIYKGRVTRVLPGMQSAFVDIGLERDAFLYVSDFFEDSEEYDRVVSEAESAVARLGAPAVPPAAVASPASPAPAGAGEASAPAGGLAAPAEPALDQRGRRGRHRGRRGRGGIPEEKFARPEGAMAPVAEPVAVAEPSGTEAAPGPGAAVSAPVSAFVLPGESLAKYRGRAPASRAAAPPAPAAAPAP